MTIDREAGELRATLRPNAGGATVALALVAVVVLAVWCLGAGALVFFGAEALGRTEPALLMHVRQLVPRPASVGRVGLVVLALWNLLWTWFTLALAGQLLRALAGSDVVTAGSDLSVTNRIGPVARTRSFAVQSVRAVSLRRKDGALTIALDDGTIEELTTWGTRAERRELRDLLRERLPLAPDESWSLPARFEETTAPDGTRVVTLAAQSRRWRIGGAVAIAAVWLASTAWHVYRDRVADPFDPMLLAAALFAAAVYFVATHEESWQVRKGWFAHVQAFGPYRKRSEYDAAVFSVEESRDSDGDLSFALSIERNGRRERLYTAANEPEEVVALGRFLAHESGFSFHGLRDD
jgi:hypothetical protein